LLHNLIRNARESRPGESVVVSIRSEQLDQGGAPLLRLQLWDNGPGFPDMVLEQPFEPYISNKGRGSGLGLAICRKIISEHNGNISIANRPGDGAQIVIDIPLTSGNP
jgi:nitrogen fixation/metabolism regulation signal transduction histidine kinase